MSVNIFEFATRNKVRFSSSRGVLTVEQLWDVPLRSKDDFNLNSIARTVNNAVKLANEDNFVEVAKTASNTYVEMSLEVVKHVISVKLAEETANKKRADNKLRKEKLLSILAEKQDNKLSAMSELELKKQIDELED